MNNGDSIVQHIAKYQAKIIQVFQTRTAYIAQLDGAVEYTDCFSAEG